MISHMPCRGTAFVLFGSELFAARRTFSLEGCGDKEAYKRLLQEYPRVARVFNSLESRCQAPIRDICKRMGAGMAEFIEKDVVSIKDFDLYCHYVAGAQPFLCLWLQI